MFGVNEKQLEVTSTRYFFLGCYCYVSTSCAHIIMSYALPSFKFISLLFSSALQSYAANQKSGLLRTRKKSLLSVVRVYPVGSLACTFLSCPNRSLYFLDGRQGALREQDWGLVAQDPWNFNSQKLSTDASNSRALLLFASEKNPHVFRRASPTLRRDKKLAKLAVNSGLGSPSVLQNDKDVFKVLVTRDGRSLRLGNSDFLRDPDIVREAFFNFEWALCWAKKEIQCDFYTVLEGRHGAARKSGVPVETGNEFDKKANASHNILLDFPSRKT